MIKVTQVSSFLEAYDQCALSWDQVRCEVTGDPWKEYQSFKDKDTDGVKTQKLLEVLIKHPENPSYRVVARKIVQSAYGDPMFAPMYDLALARIAQHAHEYDDAKKYFELYLKQYQNKTTPDGKSIEDHVHWQTVGDFYYEIRDFKKALECYQKQLRYIKSDDPKEYKPFLMKKIDAAKKRVRP